MTKQAVRPWALLLVLVQVLSHEALGFKMGPDGVPRAEIPTLGRMIGTKHVTGTAGSPYVAFRGIPYAHPPVGVHRFKPPQIHYAWQGILNASDYGPDCIQPSKVRGTSEDCLTLNIFAPGTVTEGSHFPVFVFIRGGGFMNGGGAIEPDNIMDRGDIVLITLNYRMGPFGFLSTGGPEAPGNYGLLDIIAALKWVNEYVEHFGGNKHNLTFGGFSTGAASVHLLMTSPLAKGLFTRTISMSGSALAPWVIRKNPRADAAYLGAALGCHDSNPKVLVECLREQPAEEIVRIQKAMTGTNGSAFHFVPVVDKNVLPDTPETLISKRKVLPVPWLTGRVRDEGLMGFTEEILFNPENLKRVDQNWYNYCPSLLEFQEVQADKAAKRCAAVREFYFRDRPIDYDSTYDFLSMIGDRWFEMPYAFSITFHSMIATTYGYKFNYQGMFAPINNLYIKAVGQGQKTIIGAVAHGDDMPFLFFDEKKTHHRDAAVAKAFTDMIESFIVVGEPRYVGTTDGRGGYSLRWRPFDAIAGDFVHQVVDYPVRLEAAEELTNRIHFWEDVLTDRFEDTDPGRAQVQRNMSTVSG